MKFTAYDFLVRILGLWFVNHTSHQISKRFNNKLTDMSPTEQPSIVYLSSQKRFLDGNELVSPPMSHYLDNLNQEQNQPQHSDSFTSLYIPELSLPEPAIPILPISKKKCFNIKCVKNISYYFLNVIYICFILATVSWKPIYKIIHIDKYPHWMANSFMYIIPLQYLVELNYFRTSHFYKTLSTNPGYANILNYYSICVLAASIIAAISSVFLYMFTNDVDMYKKESFYSVNELILLGIVCIFEHFFSYCIFFCSIFTFSTVFTVHSIAMHKFAKFVNDMRYDTTSINEIYEEYIVHKKEYEKSVEYLNTMFATTTILGGLATYGVFIHLPIGKFVIDIFDISYIILYIIAEIVYFYSIHKVREAINMINTTIFSGSFTKKYLSRQPFQESSLSIHPSIKSFKDIDLSHETEETRLLSLSNNINKMSRHISCISTNINDSMNSNDWVVLSMLVKRPWDNFTLLGFQVENAGFAQRILTVFFTYIAIATSLQDKMDLHT